MPLWEANLLKLIWKRIKKCLAIARRTRTATRLDATKTALRRTQKTRATRSCPSILYLDERIVDIGVLYRSTDEATTWIRVSGATEPRNAIGKVCRNLYTFEFEFEYCRRGSEFKAKNN